MAHEVAAHESHRAGASRRIFRLIPLAILLYFLSYGPAIRLATTGPRFEPAVRALYAPIRLLAQHCPPAQSALNSYVTWWRPTLDACINNLRQIDGAKQQWAIDNRISQTNFTVTWRAVLSEFGHSATGK